MTITKEAVMDLQEKYAKVIKLLEEDSKLDPQNEPYLSKYSARQILISMKASVENLLRQYKDNDDHRVKLTAMLGAVHLYLATISIDTEETTTGEKHLEKCKELISKYADRPETMLISINMYNQFGLVWAQNEPEKSKVFLEKAEQLYKKIKEESITIVHISDLFENKSSSELGLNSLEKVHTFTLYYLAQIYGALNDPLKKAVYCHKTLQSQLQMNDYDPIDWALNSATLSQFFIEKNGFWQARHHLGASLYILDEYEKQLNAITERNEAYEAKLETFRHRSADVARCWAKYGINLLLKSKERLLNRTDDIDENCSTLTDLSKLELPATSTVSEDDLQHLDFEGIEISAYELQVTHNFILTLEDAKKIFLNAQQWIAKAQEYYTLDTLASDYIETVLDHSQLYLNLLFFDDNPANQAKYHKRRADLLEYVLSKVNSQFYLQYCRQIWFDLGLTYFDILEIKSEKLKEMKGRAPPQALVKINHLVDKSIQHFNSFIDSYKEKITDEQQLPEDTERSILRAYFHLAALYGRYITLDKTLQYKHTSASLQNYKFITDYCTKYPAAKESIAVEFGICKEMVCLLPIKLLKVKHSE